MCYIVNCPLAQRRCVQIKPDKMAQKRLDYRRRITFWYMVLLLTAFLFSFDASGYQGISHVKFWVLLGLNAAYFAAMALLTMDQFLTGQLKGCKPLALWRRTGWSQRLVFLYMGFSWLSAVCSPWWPATVLGASRLEGALSITIYCLSFLLVSTYGQADRRLLGVLGMSVTLFCLLCLVQMAGFNPFGLYPDGYGYADAGMAYSGAYLGTIGNVDLVAGVPYSAIRSGPLAWAAQVDPAGSFGPGTSGTGEDVRDGRTDRCRGGMFSVPPCGGRLRLQSPP